MKFSYNQLQKHFSEPLPTADEVAEKLGLHSFELEGVEAASGGDTLIEWDILPNRSSDCLCYEGIAREINALFGLALIEDEFSMRHAGSTDVVTADHVKLTVDASGLVNRATKRIATGVTVGDSPQWLQDFLEATEQRSINNVVDITNYVMFVTGQPVHAFDYDKAAGEGVKEVTIRHAKEGEEIIDLTGDSHTLSNDMLVIADSEKGLDIAGVKGGQVSGVDENTTTLMLSACNFEYENIRNTSKKLKLHTDASKRFENEVPLGKIDDAMGLMAHLLTEHAGATVAADMVDTNPEKPEQVVLSVRHEKVNRLLGTELSTEEVQSILEKLECGIELTDGVYVVTVPQDRLDLRIEEDIVEEVGRIYGYANIAEQPIAEGVSVQAKNPFKQAQYLVVDTLVSQGFYEIYNRSITTSGVVKLKNPFTSELDSLRDNLLTELLVRADKNLAFSDEPLLFEFGNIFTGIDGEVVQEQINFAGVIGKRKIKDKHKEELFLRTKGYIELLCGLLSLREVTFVESTDELFVADLLVGGEECGSLGVNYWEINFRALVDKVNYQVEYKKPSKYPRIDRDVAVFVPAKTTVESVTNLIKELLPEETQSFELFDVFEKEDKKSFGFRMVFQSDTDTLSDAWANEVMDKVYKVLEKEGYEIR